MTATVLPTAAPQVIATVRQAIDAYVAHLRAHQAATTVAHRVLQLDQFHCWLISQAITRPADVSVAVIDGYLLTLRERDLARVTQSGHRAVLRCFGTWLARRGLVLSDPARELAPHCDRRDEDLPETPLTVDQVRRYLDAIDTTTALGCCRRAHAELMYVGGLRLSESLGLTLSRLDTARATMLIHGKGQHQRLLPIVAPALPALNAYLAVRRSLLAGPDTGILFLGATGQRVGVSAFERWMAAHGQAVLGAAVHVHPHAFRHAAAVHLLRGGAGLRQIQAFLGHANPETTAIYLRLDAEHLRLAYERAMPTMAWMPSQGSAGAGAVASGSVT